MGRAEHAQPTMSAAGWRAGLGMLPALALVLAATLLALTPPPPNNPLVLLLGVLCVLFLPGYLLALVLAPSRRELSLTRLPVFFVFSLATWALPATALQLAGANWASFRALFCAMLWALWLTALARRLRTPPPSDAASRSIVVELALGALCLGAALLVAVGPRDADDWMYLQITQQFLASDTFHILQASEARYSIRYAFHVWIFAQAFLVQWLGVDPVVLLRDQLPVLLTPLALLSFYTWGRTFFARARPALFAVVVQLAIYVTFAVGDGWGRGFFARSAQDKFLVWLVVLPVALLFAWRFLQAGRAADWIGYGAAVLAGLWIHPVSIFLVVLTLAGFALFNLTSRTRFAPQSWLWLTAASLPALLAPVVIRATTLPSVFTVNTPDVAAYLRLSEGRLLFQPPYYVADPTLIAHPLILLSLCLLVLFAPRLRKDVRVQFLWGSTLVPLALLFNPFTARVLGEMFTPWQLWRLTWNLPAAFILTEVLVEYAPRLRAHRLTRHELALGAVGAVAAALVLVSLSPVNYARSFSAFAKDHSLDPQTEDMLRAVTGTLTEPAMVLLPRDMTRYASAYSFKARVMTNDAQKLEDTTGQQIDRFYDPAADPKFLEAFLNFWEIDYAVVRNGSLQDRFLSARLATAKLYSNSKLTLYRTETTKPP